MNSALSFVRFFFSIFLASLSTTFPIIGDVGELAGGGVAGGLVGFLFLLLFYWFIVGKVFDFFAFAFGGGVGRYNTTKLYRRLQWLTFSLLMSLFVFVASVLALATTPYGEHSERYLRDVARIQSDRQEAAEVQRQAEFDNALRLRLAAIRAAEEQREEQIEAARTQRQVRIRTGTNALEAEFDALWDDIDQRETDWQMSIRSLRESLGHLSPANAAYAAEVDALAEAMQRQFGITLNRSDTFRLKGLFVTNFLVFRDVYIENDCPSLFAENDFEMMRELLIYEFCLTFVVWLNLEGNQLTDPSGNRLELPLIEQTVPVLRQGIPLFELTGTFDEERIEAEENLDTQLLVLRANNPPINEDEFAEIDPASFRRPTLNDFTLRVDRSPIVTPDPFDERLTATFLAHWWWIALTALVVWLALQSALQRDISRLQGRIMRFLDEGRFGFGGSARFASMFEEWGKPYEPGALYMGRSLFNPLDEVGLEGEAHMITVAGSRGGKGTTAIIPNLLLWEGSCVVVDPKGTNAHVTAEARRKMGHKVYLIDPFGIVTKESDRFDPLANLSNDDVLVRERIASIADALVIPDENAREKHWDDGARTIIAGLISHVVSGYSGTARSLFAIRDMIKRLPEDQDRMWAEMSVNDEGGGYAQDAAMRYIRGSETNEILGIMSNADKHTEWLSSDVMRGVTSEPTFNLSDLKKEPTTVYLIIPPRQLTKQNRLIRLFINLMLDAMEDGGRSEIPVLMMIDEFLALERMPEIPTAFATMASYNLVIWLFVQDLMGLQKKYKDEFNAFIANSRAMQVFATTDDVTKEYVSKRLGNRPLSTLGGIAKSNDNVPIRAPDDIEKDLKASEGRQYVIEAGSSAMLIEKVPYFKKRSRFAGKFSQDPDFAR